MKKKNGFLFALLCLTYSISAQDNNLSQRSQFGISLQLNNSYTDITTADFAAIGLFDEYEGIESENAFGFGLGIMYRYQLTSFLATRLQGVLAFTEQAFLFNLNDGSFFRRKRELVAIELPLHFVFEKADKKIAPSAFFGARYSFDLAANAESTTNPIRGNYRHDDFLVDAGVGVAFNLKLFTFKPEIVYSRGLMNQSPKDSGIQLDQAFESIYTNRFTLRLSFYN